MLWRLHIRPAPKGNKTHEDVINYCMQYHVAGIGWPVNTTPLTAEEYETAARQTYGIKPASVRFASAASVGDLIWARDLSGVYYLGRITSEWYYDNTPESLALDIPNQRKCDWIEVGNEEKVPGKVIACFRPSRAFQAIRDPEIEAFTAWLYDGGLEKFYLKGT